MSDYPVNHQIKARQVRVVDEQGQQIGVMTIREAGDMTRQSGLDLVQITGGEIPVCRICDAGKFLFKRKKVQRENARRQRSMQVEIKEIQLRPVTDRNDLLVKARRAAEFLAEGDKVKIVVRFKGRERAHKDLGRDTLEQFLRELSDFKFDRQLSDSGRDLNIVISPLRSKSELKAAKDNSPNDTI